MDKVFSALASASRRKLLDALYKKNGQTLLELCANLRMSRQAASKHLAILEKAELVITLWQGREKMHYLNPVPLQVISERWIRKFEQKRLEAIALLKTALEGDKEKRDG
ncbi:MAG TPA: helix-turn-helix domain-containing protein [Spirochaetia bacterium]|nr:helix-turn-helix domain-containing protein [Spirochaetia bacterium]